MRRIAWLLLTWLHASAALGQPSKPQDFAYGLALTSSAAPGLHAFTLPHAVLERLTDRALGDLCVFDAEGGQLAHALGVPAQAAPAATERALAIFPLEVRAPRAGEEEVAVERDAKGAILRAISRRLLDPGTPTASYLLDASEDMAPIESLTLTLAGAPTYRVEVEVHASEVVGEPTDVPARSPSADAAAAVLEEHRAPSQRSEPPDGYPKDPT